MLLSPVLFSNVLEGLVSTIELEKEIKDIDICKKEVKLSVYR